MAHRAHLLLADSFEWVKPTLKFVYKAPLIGLAFLYRRVLRRTVVVGVTGSCGKTTTKDLVDAALSSTMRGTKSDDSGNRHYAVARTLLSLRPSSHYCVQELGATGPGSLDGLLRMLKPRIGVVTNIGMDHCTAFRTREATAHEKGKLIAALPRDGVAVLNVDDPSFGVLRSRSTGKVLTFGLSPGADVRGTNVTSAWPNRLSCCVEYDGESHPIQTKLCGAHWVHSVLAALAVGIAAGVPLTDAIRRIGGMDPMRGRMQPVTLDTGVVVIRDDWKGSLSSIPTALDFIRHATAVRRILVFGAITDFLGNTGRTYRSVARRSLEVADYVFFVGQYADSVLKLREPVKTERLRAFASLEEAHHWMQGFLRAGDLVLIKSANSAHLARLVLAMERPVNCWRSNCGRTHTACDGCSLLAVPGGD